MRPEDLVDTTKSALQWHVISAPCLIVGLALVAYALRMEPPTPSVAPKVEPAVTPTRDAEKSVKIDDTAEQLKIKAREVQAKAAETAAKDQKLAGTSDEDRQVDAAKVAREADKARCELFNCFVVYLPNGAPGSFDFLAGNIKCAKAYNNCTLKTDQQAWRSCVKNLQGELGLALADQDGLVGDKSAKALKSKKDACAGAGD